MLSSCPTWTLTLHRQLAGLGGSGLLSQPALFHVWVQLRAMGEEGSYGQGTR